MTLPTLLLTLLLLMAPGSAEAYIDPGTGGLVVQMLLAAIATALVTVKLWWARFTALFKKDTPPLSNQTQEDSEADDK